MLRKFLMVKFAPGSGGKYLCSLLQLSPDVNPWYAEAHGSDPVSWFKSHFSDDFVNWTRNEPAVPYEAGFYSAKHPRGDDISFDQAQTLLKDDTVFQQHWHNDKLICLILCKPRVPDFVHGRGCVVNLHIDNVTSWKWVNRARLHKQYLQKDPSTWILKQDHPDYCPPNVREIARRFNNPNEYQGSYKDFLNRYIVHDHSVQTFVDKNLITDQPGNGQVEQYFVNLSDLLNPNRTARAMAVLCEQMNIRCPDLETIEQISQHYYHIHRSILPKQLLTLQ
jgi:hypothetical protein